MSIIETIPTEVSENAMSLTAILTELKYLNAWFDGSNSSSATMAIAVVGSEEKKPHNSSWTLEATTSAIQSNYDNYVKRIERFTTLRRALLKANAQATITLNGEKLTIIEAVDYRANLSKQKSFLSAMLKSLNQAETAIANSREYENAEEDKFNRSLAANESNSQEVIQALRTDYMKARAERTLTLHDPCNIKNKVIELEREIDSINETLDAILSEKNSTTYIVVD